ncbi:MAG: cytochrome C oxidase subunit IV family protein [Bacteroidota bacterium]|nr:cytochrome C oxidase subunit IV family protein [Bacteroidota bacterium]
MEHTDNTEHTEHHEGHGISKKAIWRTFGILSFLTVVDFAIFFNMDGTMSRNMIFVALGIIKSYYIVGIFMHMNYEVKRLAGIILLPFGFILGLIAALLYEGDRWSVIKWFVE